MPAVLKSSFSKCGIGTLSLVHPFQATKSGPDPGNVSSALRSRRKGQDMYFNQVEFGKRIKEERNRLQMTQEDLAQELNIGYVHMNGIENGRKGCSIDLLLEIAEVLDVSTDYLLTGRLSGGTNTAKNKLKEIAARLNEIVGQLDA